jgi:hypothetical protein
MDRDSIMLEQDVLLSTGRLIRHEYDANGYTQRATPILGGAMSKSEWLEYYNIIRERNLHRLNQQIEQMIEQQPDKNRAAWLRDKLLEAQTSLLKE